MRAAVQVPLAVGRVVWSIFSTALVLGLLFGALEWLRAAAGVAPSIPGLGPLHHASSAEHFGIGFASGWGIGWALGVLRGFGGLEDYEAPARVTAGALAGLILFVRVAAFFSPTSHSHVAAAICGTVLGAVFGYARRPEIPPAVPSESAGPAAEPDADPSASAEPAPTRPKSPEAARPATGTSGSGSLWL